MPTKSSKPLPGKVQPRRKSGRPTEIDRGALLDAAEALFAENGFDGTTTREVVKRAGCNIALISYYFGGKDGLYQAVLVRYFEAVKLRYNEVDYSEAALKKQWPMLKDPEERIFCAAFYEFARKIASGSPIQKILCREMMTGAEKMAAALAQSEGGAFNLLTGRLKDLQKRGKLKPGLDLRMGVIGLIGPVVYSCVAAPILVSIYGFAKLDDKYVRDLCVHQTRTFFEGWGA